MNARKKSAADAALPDDRWIVEAEPILGDLGCEIAMIGYAEQSNDDVPADHWLHIENHLMDLHDELQGLWRAAWDRRAKGKAPDATDPADMGIGEIVSLGERIAADIVAVAKSPDPSQDMMFHLGAKIARALNNARPVRRSFWPLGSRVGVPSIPAMPLAGPGVQHDRPHKNVPRRGTVAPGSAVRPGCSP
jgi:hypothetical protein